MKAVIGAEDEAKIFDQHIQKERDRLCGLKTGVIIESLTFYSHKFQQSRRRFCVRNDWIVWQCKLEILFNVGASFRKCSIAN